MKLPLVSEDGSSDVESAENYKKKLRSKRGEKKKRFTEVKMRNRILGQGLRLDQKPDSLSLASLHHFAFGG